MPRNGNYRRANSGDTEHALLDGKFSAREERESPADLLSSHQIDEKFGKTRSRKKSFPDRHKSKRERINSEVAIESSGSHK